jgi:hypothetical protein
MAIDLMQLAARNFIQDNWQTVISTLSGTFLGAYFAFLFERRHSSSKEYQANIASARKAQFAIWTQLNAAINIKQCVLDPKKDDPNRHLTLTPFSVFGQYSRLEISTLSFLLKKEGAKLLADMMIAEDMFFTLLGALDQRNSRHEQMQRNISLYGPEAALDEATVKILKDMTDSIFGLGNDAIEHLDKVFKQFRNHLKVGYPDEEFLSMADLRD